MSANTKSATFDRMKRKVAREEAIGGAKAQLLADDVEDRLAALEKEDRIEQLLTELKDKARSVAGKSVGSGELVPELETVIGIDMPGAC
jgi:phage shock protein A